MKLIGDVADKLRLRIDIKLSKEGSFLLVFKATVISCIISRTWGILLSDKQEINIDLCPVIVTFVRI